MSDIFKGQNSLKNLHEFSIKGFRDIRKVVSENKIVGVSLVGDSLKHEGVLHGDLLIVEMSNRFPNEIELAVWETPNGRTAKYARRNGGDIVLHNNADWIQIYSRDEVKPLGLVVRIERDLK